jgi:hypothetical protein
LAVVSRQSVDAFGCCSSRIERGKLDFVGESEPLGATFIVFLLAGWIAERRALDLIRESEALAFAFHLLLLGSATGSLLSSSA